MGESGAGVGTDSRRSETSTARRSDDLVADVERTGFFFSRFWVAMGQFCGGSGWANKLPAPSPAPAFALMPLTPAVSWWTRAGLARRVAGIGEAAAMA